MIAVAAAAVIALLGQSAAPAVKSGHTPPDPNKVICRETQVTGSIIGGKRICMKRSEWERQSSDTQRDLNGWNNHVDPTNHGGG